MKTTSNRLLITFCSDNWALLTKIREFHDPCVPTLLLCLIFSKNWHLRFNQWYHLRPDVLLSSTFSKHPVSKSIKKTGSKIRKTGPIFKFWNLLDARVLVEWLTENKVNTKRISFPVLSGKTSYAYWYYWELP